MLEYIPQHLQHMEIQRAVNWRRNMLLVVFVLRATPFHLSLNKSRLCFLMTSFTCSKRMSIATLERPIKEWNDAGATRGQERPDPALFLQKLRFAEAASSCRPHRVRQTPNCVECSVLLEDQRLSCVCTEPNWLHSISCNYQLFNESCVYPDFSPFFCSVCFPPVNRPTAGGKTFPLSRLSIN